MTPNCPISCWLHSPSLSTYILPRTLTVPVHSATCAPLPVTVANTASYAVRDYSPTMDNAQTHAPIKLSRTSSKHALSAPHNVRHASTFTTTHAWAAETRASCLTVALVIVHAAEGTTRTKLNSVLMVSNVKMCLDAACALIRVSAMTACPTIPANRSASTPRSSPKISSFSS